MTEIEMWRALAMDTSILPLIYQADRRIELSNALLAACDLLEARNKGNIMIRLMTLSGSCNKPVFEKEGCPTWFTCISYDREQLMRAKNPSSVWVAGAFR